MNNRDMEHILKKIRDVVQNGVQAINRKVEESRKDPDIIDAPQPPAIYEEKPWRKVAGVLLAAAGFGWGGVTCLSTMVLLLGASLVGEMALGLGFAAFNALIIGGCGFMAYKGTTMVTSSNRFQIYKKAIGDEELCNIKQLAEKVRKSERFVVKDVEKMIRKGWFCQGHLDTNKTCLMVTDHMYREYQKLEAEREQHRIEEEARKRQAHMEEEARKLKQMAEEERAEKEARAQKREAFWNGSKNQKKGSLSPEVKRVLEQGDEYVKKIRRCNEAIPGEVISAKIDHMEVLVDKIFDRVEQNPACVGDIRKLMEYYLPTTVKLLETYAEMDAQPVGGSNIQTTKKEIEHTLDTINIAFEKLLDSLFQEAAWDVSSDISVLHTMLAQEGLTEDGIKK